MADAPARHGGRLPDSGRPLKPGTRRPPAATGGDATSAWPGLILTAAVVAVSLVASEFSGISALVLGVLLGAAIANAGVLRPTLLPGVVFAGKHLLRAGIVFLGLRLSLDQLGELGVVGALTVVGVVFSTFVGVQLLGRALGLSSGLSLLVATGYSICGASAIAAMEPMSDADEAETAYAIGMVTLCGTLSIFVLPVLGDTIGLDAQHFGAWAGAGVHDVGQVAATASAFSSDALPTATLVKLTRVIMLAPMVALVGVRRRQVAGSTSMPPASQSGATSQVSPEPSAARPPLVPLFVALFLVAIAVRAIGILSENALSVARDIEKALLTAGMFGLGAGVVFARLRRLGGRPLVFGLLSWLVVAVVAFGASVLIVR